MKLRFTEVAAMGVASGLLLGLWAGVATAQLPQGAFQDRQWNQRRQQQQQMQQQQMQALALRTSGTVDMVAAGRIQMLTADGQAWLLQLTPNTQLEVRGTASSEFLQPGQFVSFIATVDKHAKVDAPIDKLTIFTPDDQHIVGVFPEGTGLPPAGAAGEPGGKNDTSLQPVPIPKVPVPNAAPAAETYEIAGRISKLKNGKMTVTAPNSYFKGALNVELAEQVAIDLSLRGTDGLGLVQKGDKIEAVGVQIAERGAQAVQVTIELGQPIGTPEKKKPMRRAPAGRSKGDPSAQPQDASLIPQGPAQEPRGRTPQ